MSFLVKNTCTKNEIKASLLANLPGVSRATVLQSVDVAVLEMRPMWGKSVLLSPVDAWPTYAGTACLSGDKHSTDARAEQMIKHGDPEQLQEVAALSW